MIVSIVVIVCLMLLGLVSAVTNSEEYTLYLVTFMLGSVVVLPLITIL